MGKHTPKNKLNTYDKYRFIIYPGQIRDRSIGEFVYYSYESLIALYKLPPELCINGEHSSPQGKNYIKLVPLQKENYAEVLADKLFSKEFYK